MITIALKPSIPPYFGSHDGAVALFDNLNLCSLIEEERFSRQKHAFNQFPTQALHHSLEMHGLTLAEIDAISIPFAPDRWFFAEKRHPQEVLKEANQIVRSALSSCHNGGAVQPIRYFSHHQCHAASAFYCSHFDEAVVIVIDGTGERESSSIWFGENGTLAKLAQFDWPNSLGVLYADFTEFLGFERNQGEGKTMGLATYGELSSRLKSILGEKILAVSQAGYKVHPDYAALKTPQERLRYIGNAFSLDPLLKQRREQFEPEYVNLAHLIQDALERAVFSLIDIGLRMRPTKHLCLAGGVAMNCGMNGKIFDRADIDDIFIQPLAGDNGSVIGAGLMNCIDHGYFPESFGLDTLSLGTSYTEKDITAALAGCGLDYEIVDKPWQHAARFLRDGKIVGWFRGRMEAGARALGNRSILCNPTKRQFRDKLNDRVKHRESWRPFAMSILEEYQSDYLKGKPLDCAQFMIIAREVVDFMLTKIPAAVHIDGTSRPQVVRKSANPDFHALIETFYSLTGIPLVVNTSMNDRGEPIIESPAQALSLFQKSGLEVLFIENFMLVKPDA